MAETFKFELVSPERLLMSADVNSVKVPGDEGDFVVLPDHAPFMSTMRPGMVLIEAEDGEHKYFVKGGFSQVEDSGLTILAEESVEISELKGDRLQDEIANARKRLESTESDHAKRHESVLIDFLEEIGLVH